MVTSLSPTKASPVKSPSSEDVLDQLAAIDAQYDACWRERRRGLRRSYVSWSEDLIRLANASAHLRLGLSTFQRCGRPGAVKETTYIGGRGLVSRRRCPAGCAEMAS